MNAARALVTRAVQAICQLMTLAVLAGFLPLSVFAQQLVPLPALKARVTDLTSTLSAEEAARLEFQLAELERRKGAQVVVVIVPTTGPEPISDYSIRLAEAWKIGRGKVEGKKVDDGVILLVARNDRKVRIEVGYGLEGAIPDAIAKRIITEAIAPRFREGHYGAGLEAAIKDIARLIEGEALPAPWPDQGRQGGQSSDNSGGELGLQGDWFSSLIFALVGGFIASMILGRFLGSTLGGAGAWFLGGAAGMAAPLPIAAGVGVFLLLMMFSPRRRRGLSRFDRHTYRPGPVIFPGGWGGGGGFGGGGGGFGGGGGGFGGGGASGDW